MDDTAAGVVVLFGVVLAIPVYFLPTVVASFRNHTNLVALLALNLCLGWTLLGWVGALVWAFLQEQTGPARGRYAKGGRRAGPNPFDDE